MLVYFDNTLILNATLSHIKREDTVYVVGCMAWFTHPDILQCLSDYTRGCSIVCTKQKFSIRTQELYTRLPSIRGACAIRQVGTTGGYKSQLMHHKFILGLDVTSNPLWVITGSFNMTSHAMYNIENTMVLYDTDSLTQFYREYRRVFSMSQGIPIHASIAFVMASRQSLQSVSKKSNPKSIVHGTKTRNGVLKKTKSKSKTRYGVSKKTKAKAREYAPPKWPILQKTKHTVSNHQPPHTAKLSTSCVQDVGSFKPQHVVTAVFG